MWFQDAEAENRKLADKQQHKEIRQPVRKAHITFDQQTYFIDITSRIHAPHTVQKLGVDSRDTAKRFSIFLLFRNSGAVTAQD